VTGDVSGGRGESGRGRLARAGLTSGDASDRRLESLNRLGGEVLAAFAAASADPDLALRSLSDLAGAAGDPLLRALVADPLLRRRLAAVLGTSAALGEFSVRHPTIWQELADGAAPFLSSPGDLRAALLTAVAADPEAPAPVSGFDDARAVDALRVEYHRRLLHIAARDLSEGWHLEAVGAVLADLAAAALEAALAIARVRLGESAAACRLAIIALGKTGGRELNYISDVDVVFVHQPTDRTPGATALQSASRLAAHVMRICSVRTAEGALWEVDAGLRPEGRAGPLVRTLDSHLAYYATWARTWEFQALLKARPVAGDVPLGQQYTAAVNPLVWQAADRDGFVAEVQQMRRRVVANLPLRASERELKLGPGGLRDVEFAVQLLQLVHGRTDETLRSPTTLVALAALTEGGYVGRVDGAAMAEAYRFLRSLEHRVQLHRLRRTHLVPTAAADLRRLGRGLGLLGDPAAELEREWRRHRWEVRRLHEKLFYRPLLRAVAALPEHGMRLTPEAARARLTALGYADPSSAMRHLEALTSGVSRRAAIQRQLLPAMLAWFADCPDPDAALLAFRTLSERMGTAPWYLRQLRDESAAAEQLARVLGYSRYATGLLAGASEAVAIFGRDEELYPRTADQLLGEVAAAVARHTDAGSAIRVVRAIRRRELCRIAVADVLGRLEVDAVGEALTDVAIATLTGGLLAASAAVVADTGRPLPTRLAVVAMGRLGGRETSYGSDADVMFVHVPEPDADEQVATEAASAVAQRMCQLLSAPGPDPALGVDADLRPEGRQGPLVRSLSSYAAYYARWSSAWEAQALLRADAVIGDGEVRRHFSALIEPLRWPAGGVSERDVAEIRRVKARVDAERLPRGADPGTHLKLGRGALADVEWAVQLLQLRHGHAVLGLQTTRTLRALDAAVAAELIDVDDGVAMARAWRLASRLRNAITLVRGRPSDALPPDPQVRAAVAVLLGYPAADSERLQDDYRRTSRRSRAAVERVFLTEPGDPPIRGTQA